ncbi:MAG: heavy metal translocating P-type ATPase, partial [Candidatus Izemoplasmatales bacterium]
AFSSGIISLFVIATGFAENNMEMIHLGRMNLYFEAAGAILVFVSLGKHVESISKQRSTTAVKQLLDLSPETAWVKREGDFKEIPTNEIQIGDLILVKPGMVIPVDGTIESGSSDIDESLITGENIPVFKREGDPVISATINKTQAFQFRAEKVGSETTIAKIIDLVETTIARKMPIQKLADKISGVFVPIVLLISIITFITWMIVGETVGGALSMAIAVLVISCPCALGLATPVAVMVAMGKGAEASILIKNPDILEIIHKVDVILFDKTGTLTTGNPEVTDVIPYQGVKESDLLRVAGSLEQYSNHPIAKGILRFVNIKEVDLDEITQMSEIPGKGLKGTWLGKQVMVGNQVLFPKDLPLPSDLVTISESLFNQGKTVSYVLLEQQYLGLIACQDQLRHDSKEAINSLRKLGLKTIMLTGDTPLAATAIQKQINLDHVYSQVKPEEKATIIRQMLQNGEVVAMVGDGINDAVALSESSVGIAIGAGSDVAIDSADIVLMHSNLNDVEKAIILGRKTLNTIKTNLFWAFVYNLVGIPIA